MRRAELEQFRDATAPDLLGDDVRLLFVGINPSLWTAATGAHFAHPANRFYRALYRAGLTQRLLEVSEGYSDEDREHLLERGIGVTNLCERATARAAELSDAELRAGAGVLERKVRRIAPRVLAFVGIGAYRTAYSKPDASVGRQEKQVAESEVWVLPNPSGLNAHYRLEELARLYREAGLAAGVL